MKVIKITTEMADRLNELQVPTEVMTHTELRGDFIAWTKGRRLMVVVAGESQVWVVFRKIKSKK